MFNIDLIDKSVTTETAGMPDEVGISVALWRLKELINGYKVAVSLGYKPVIIADKEDHL